MLGIAPWMFKDYWIPWECVSLMVSEEAVYNLVEIEVSLQKTYSAYRHMI